MCICLYVFGNKYLYDCTQTDESYATDFSGLNLFLSHISALIIFQALSSSSGRNSQTSLQGLVFLLLLALSINVSNLRKWNEECGQTMKPVKYFQLVLVSDDENPGLRCRRLHCLLCFPDLIWLQFRGPELGAYSCG